MKKTLIVYEDGKKNLEEVAHLIAASLTSLGSKDGEVKVRAASGVTTAELLASDRYMFGAEVAEAPSFGEIARIFAGINLAGRTAAFFSTSDSALTFLKAMVADTDLGRAPKDLRFSRPEAAEIAAWVSSLP